MSRTQLRRAAKPLRDTECETPRPVGVDETAVYSTVRRGSAVRAFGTSEGGQRPPNQPAAATQRDAGNLSGSSSVDIGMATQPGSDGESFRAFLSVRHAALLRSAWLLTGDGVEAEDLLQETLTKVWRHWGRISRDGTPELYVRKAMLGTHISWLRKKRVAAILSPRESDTESLFESAELRPSIMAALRGLPPRQRAVIVLRYYEDLSEEKTAALLHCSVGTVKSQRHKALAKLRELYEMSQLMGSD